LNIEELVQQITNEVVSSLDTRCPIGEKCGNCKGDFFCATEKSTEVQELIRLGASRIGAGIGIPNVGTTIAGFIDHTLLKPESSPKEIQVLCKEAKKYNFASVCIHPSFVELAAELLHGTSVKVCTVVGFPLGTTSSEVKAYEAKIAKDKGATEIDMVIHIGALKSLGDDYVEQDIRSVVNAVSPTLVKVIIETALLTDEEKIRACRIAKKAGAHYVKTSTGFSKGGATAADVALMRRVVGESMGVKASGGMRDLKAVQLMIQAGATRIGASASVKIVEGKDGGGGY